MQSLKVLWTSISVLFSLNFPTCFAVMLNWADYSDLCLVEDSWTQRADGQLLCAKFVGMPFVEWSGHVNGVLLKPGADAFIFHQFLHAFLNDFWPLPLKCIVKISLPTKRNLMGSLQYKIIQAAVQNTNQCLQIELGQRVQFSGFVMDYGDLHNVHLYIQNLLLS